MTGLTRSGTDALQLYPYGNSGRQRVNINSGADEWRYDGIHTTSQNNCEQLLLQSRWQLLNTTSQYRCIGSCTAKL